MPGRKQFDVDAALEAAMRVFWTYGYPATSIDQLTAATGLGKGSLYGTFGSKDALFRRALDLYADTYGTRYERAMNRHANPVGAIRAYFEVLLRRLADPSVPDGCLLCQSVTDGQALEDAGRHHAQALLNLQLARIRAALSSSELPGRELDELARLAVTVQQGIVVMHRGGTPIRQLRSTAKLTCEAVASRLAASDGSRQG